MDQSSGLPPEGESAGPPTAPALGRAAGTHPIDFQARASRLAAVLSSLSVSASHEAAPAKPPPPPPLPSAQARPALTENHVNLDLVREMIAQHAIEITIILVIVIYLVYYFSKISRKPKLIGNPQSAFVAAIKQNFKQTLQSRFSPLIYFWGTNPQTCLFGYLQGQTSNDEMPRSKFHRQFLYVSDAQYLASNIDLSEHYGTCEKRHLNGSSVAGRGLQIFHHHHYQDHAQQQQQQQHQEQQTHELRRAKEPQNQLHANMAASCCVAGEKSDQSLLQRNLQMVISGASGERHKRLTRTASGDCSDSSAIGSSSDSGVFANEHSPSSSISSSSRSSLTIDMSSVSGAPSRQSSSSSTRSAQSTSSGCACSSLYAPPHNEPHQLDLDELEPADQQQVENKSALLSRDLKHPSQQFKREQFEFGQCALDWFVDSHQQYHANKSVALISAGMTTGSDKKYVTDTVRTLHELGYEVCVFIRRGVGGLKLNSTKFFSPSKWRDFEAAILSIKRQRPNCRLVSIGFSFGSIELCRYLSMSGTRSLVDRALLISCPFDPEAGGRNMRKRALNRKIDAYLAKNLGKQLHQALSFDDPAATESSTASSSSSSSSTSSRSTDEADQTTLEMLDESGGPKDKRKRLAKSVSEDGTSCSRSAGSRGKDPSTSPRQVHVNYNGSVVDLSGLPKIRSLVDFEDNYNRVIQHYPCSDAYGADSRLNDQLANIRTPTLCLSSEDDFMAPVKLLPIKEVEANTNLCMILTKRGGHMAFIDGLVWPKRPYYAQRIIGEYMKLPPPPEAVMVRPAEKS